MKEKYELMNAQDIERTVLRLSHEIIEKNHGINDLVIVGIRNRGDCLARRIIACIQNIEGQRIPLGILDITLYRDDFQKLTEQPIVQETDISSDITEKKIILIDDVLYTISDEKIKMNDLDDLDEIKEVDIS